MRGKNLYIIPSLYKEIDEIRKSNINMSIKSSQQKIVEYTKVGKEVERLIHRTTFGLYKK